MSGVLESGCWRRDPKLRFGRAFLLTPALSPEEREFIGARFRTSNALSFDPALGLLGEKSAGMCERVRAWQRARLFTGRRTILPLLGGEGRGEGERGATISGGSKDQWHRCSFRIVTPRKLIRRDHPGLEVSNG